MLGTRWLAIFTTGLQEVKGAQTQAERVLKAQAEAEASGVKSFILRMRGVPFQATEEDIKQFFLPLTCVENGILIPRKRGSGYATGEAFAQFVSAKDMEKAMLKHKEEIMGRFIELFKSSRPEVEYAAAKAAGKSVAAAMVPREEPRPRGDTEAVVKIRGLPFGASDDDIKEFFADLPIADRGIQYLKLANGHKTGEAFIIFDTEEAITGAVALHKDHMGERYLEVYASTHDDMMLRKPDLADTEHIQYLRDKRPSHGGGGGGYSGGRHSYQQRGGGMQGRGGYPVAQAVVNGNGYNHHHHHHHHHQGAAAAQAAAAQAAAHHGYSAAAQNQQHHHQPQHGNAGAAQHAYGQQVDAAAAGYTQQYADQAAYAAHFQQAAAAQQHQHQHQQQGQQQHAGAAQYAQQAAYVAGQGAYGQGAYDQQAVVAQVQQGQQHQFPQMWQAQQAQLSVQQAQQAQQQAAQQAQQVAQQAQQVQQQQVQQQSQQQQQVPGQQQQQQQQQQVQQGQGQGSSQSQSQSQSQGQGQGQDQQGGGQGPQGGGQGQQGSQWQRQGQGQDASQQQAYGGGAQVQAMQGL